MAEVNELYLFQDDFGTILEILEDEEELDEQFREAAIEVSVSNFYSILKYQEKLRLKWYCDENHIFPIEPILKHEQVACVTRKVLFTIFKYLFWFQRYLSF